MAGVIVYEPDDESEVEGLPWAVTFEASAGEDWAPFVCGPYERDEAVRLAEEVLAGGRGVTAVVEPLLPLREAADVLATIEELREEG
ncbi:hypothetical protein [Saccharothrix syringae]|uniref:Uncharacterized protein n=1 Tax=Saccharothrix syringae TaxID=103733 RepID=A0A5Q0GVB9_SACSY|nr:hypothetical protein [Saccharothrix syringae]QFZ17302.1 hypothetical protein EKG83_07295 [Saccharothrix syringae]